MTLADIVKVIAETYREDAERNDLDTCRDVFNLYSYDSDEVKEEIYYSLVHDFNNIPNVDFTFYDDCSIVLNDGTDIPYRKLISEIRKYKFN